MKRERLQGERETVSSWLRGGVGDRGQGENAMHWGPGGCKSWGPLMLGGVVEVGRRLQVDWYLSSLPPPCSFQNSYINFSENLSLYIWQTADRISMV